MHLYFLRMKVFFNIPQKFKAALLLFVIVVIVLITSSVENSNVKAIDSSFSSIYEDRLIPANELFHLTDLMYQKILLTSDFFNKTKTDNETINLMSHFNSQIDSIISEYEKTYLVAEENKTLFSFKTKIGEYNNIENSILQSHNEILLDQQLEPKFNEIRGELVRLSRIQTTVGQQLLNNSHEIKVHSSILHYCQLALILVILLIIQSILFSAKSIVPKKPQNFKLN